MFQVDMDSELIVIEEMFLAKVTVWMQEDNIPKLVNISSLDMFVQLIECV
jgi:hypothetical protein